jgi:phage terminase small subunit
MAAKRKMPAKATEHAQSANPGDEPIYLPARATPDETVDGLSMSEHKFCMEYVKRNDDGTNSVLAAYPGQFNGPVSAGVFASSLMRRPLIKDRIRHLKRELIQVALVTLPRLVVALADQAFADRRQLFDDDGVLKPVQKWPAWTGHTINTIKVTERVMRPKSFVRGDDPDDEVVVERRTEIKMDTPFEAKRILAEWQGMIGKQADDANSKEEVEDVSVINGDVLKALVEQRLAEEGRALPAYTAGGAGTPKLPTEAEIEQELGFEPNDKPIPPQQT